MLECTDTLEAADLSGPHRWRLILSNSSSVSLLTYKAIVAVRYPELVLHDQSPIHMSILQTTGDFEQFSGSTQRICVQQWTMSLSCSSTFDRHKEFPQGATSQLMVLCNCTAVHDQLRQHLPHSLARRYLRVHCVHSWCTNSGSADRMRPACATQANL